MTGLFPLATVRVRPRHAVAGWLLASAVLHALAFMALPGLVGSGAQPVVRVLDVVVLARDPQPASKLESTSVSEAVAATPPVSRGSSARRGAASAASKRAPPHTGAATAGAATAETMAAPEGTARQNESTAPSPAPSGSDVVSAAPAQVDDSAPPARAEAPLTPPVFNAAYLRNPPPRYPLVARRNGEQGTVTLRVLVRRDGLPASVDIEKTSGSPPLDNAAREAVRSWRFVPARRGVQAVEAWVLVPVVFRLEDAS